MENNTILTENELTQVIDKLEDSKNESDELLAKIEEEHADDDNSNDPLEEGEGEYVSPGVILSSEEDNKDFIEFNHFENIDSKLDDIVNDNLKDALAANYNLSDEEVLKFANLIMRVRAGEKFNMFPELPKVLQQHIIDMTAEQNIPVSQIAQFHQFSAEMIINELINDAELDALSIDLEKAMKELLPAPMEMYSEFNKDYIENEFLVTAEKIREENPKTADNLLAMRSGFIDAYTYSIMYEMLENPKIVKNIRRAEVLWSRTNTEYLRLANACKFKLYSLSDIHKALVKLGFSDIQSKRIITLFVYTYTNGVDDYNDETVYNDIYRNAFANYFEMNINNLAITPDLQTDFSKQIRKNLDRLCHDIDTVIEIKDAELSNKKKKKRG